MHGATRAAAAAHACSDARRCSRAHAMWRGAGGLLTAERASELRAHLHALAVAGGSVHEHLPGEVARAVEAALGQRQAAIRERHLA
jgi:hypothetical protein